MTLMHPSTVREESNGETAKQMTSQWKDRLGLTPTVSHTSLTYVRCQHRHVITLSLFNYIVAYIDFFH